MYPCESGTGVKLGIASCECIASSASAAPIGDLARISCDNFGCPTGNKDARLFQVRLWHRTTIRELTRASCALHPSIHPPSEDPMVDVMGVMGDRTGISSFYISFVLAPLASNASELIAAFNYSLKKTSRTIVISFAALQVRGEALIFHLVVMYSYVDMTGTWHIFRGSSVRCLARGPHAVAPLLKAPPLLLPRVTGRRVHEQHVLPRCIHVPHLLPQPGVGIQRGDGQHPLGAGEPEVDIESIMRCATLSSSKIG